MMPRKFRDRSNGSGVILLIDRQTNRQTMSQTDTVTVLKQYHRRCVGGNNVILSYHLCLFEAGDDRFTGILNNNNNNNNLIYIAPACRMTSEARLSTR